MLIWHLLGTFRVAVVPSLKACGKNSSVFPQALTMPSFQAPSLQDLSWGQLLMRKQLPPVTILGR